MEDINKNLFENQIDDDDEDEEFEEHKTLEDKKKKVKKNTLRDRSPKFPDITEEMWQEVNEENRDIVEEYFESNQQLSSESQKQYRSGLRQFFWWVRVKCKNKPLYEIKKRDFIKYISYLQNHGLASNSMGFKKSSVSSLCNFIENIVAEESDEYEDFRNFTRGLPPIPKNKVYEKIKVSKEEYDEMMTILEEQKDYLGMAWTSCAFNVGARRAELVQFKTEMLDYGHHKNSKGEEQNYTLSHIVRGKGKSRDGKPVRYMINDEAMKYIKLYLENRDFKSDYIFAINWNGEIKPISKQWANGFCANKLSIIAGRRINPHLFKASCITYLLESGKDIKIVSKYVAQHESVETTQIYDLREDEDARDSLF